MKTELMILLFWGCTWTMTEKEWNITSQHKYSVTEAIFSGIFKKSTHVTKIPPSETVVKKKKEQKHHIFLTAMKQKSHLKINRWFLLQLILNSTADHLRRPSFATLQELQWTAQGFSF